MKNHFVAKVEVMIQASVSRVWDALINPAMIKQYLHGTDAQSDWQSGSPLIFKGVWNGKEYLDKGIVLEKVDERLLKYSWLSSLSGLEDEKENYSIITYRLTPINGGTSLLLTQENITDEKSKEASEKHWTAVLTELKHLLESGRR
jgi:uncharacterized protein YndB with AHSA1/START domain